jgi:hypothetical protein
MQQKHAKASPVAVSFENQGTEFKDKNFKAWHFLFFSGEIQRVEFNNALELLFSRF